MAAVRNFVEEIPFMDADCDGSVSSLGTASLLGASSSDEDAYSRPAPRNPRLRHHYRHQDYEQNDGLKLDEPEQHDYDDESLNNVLDSVSVALTIHTQHPDMEDDDEEPSDPQREPMYEELHQPRARSSTTRLPDEVRALHLGRDTLDAPPPPKENASTGVPEKKSKTVSVDVPRPPAMWSPASTRQEDRQHNWVPAVVAAYAALSQHESQQVQSLYEPLYPSSPPSSLSSRTPSLATPTSPSPSVGSRLATPTHYISSLRASMRTGQTLDRERDKDPCQRLRTYLKSSYADLCEVTMPNLAWCPDFKLHVSQLVTSLAIDTSWARGRDRDEGARYHNNALHALALQPLPLHRLFAEERRSHQGGKGQRVLIVGEAGYGKTSFCLRLLYDWVHQERPWVGNYLSYYQWIFFIPLRDFVVNKSLFYCGNKDSYPSDLDNPAQIIQTNEAQVLFIVDGWDQWTGDLPVEIQDLLDGTNYPLSTVMVTSRPMPHLMRHATRWADKRVVLRGLDFNQVDIFVRSYFQTAPTPVEPERVEKFLQWLANPQQRWGKLASSPVMCISMCLAFEEQGDLWWTGNLSAIFSAIIHCLVRRSLDQSGEISTLHRKMLLDLGKLALQCIKQNRYFYTDLDLKQHCQFSQVIKMGLLVKAVSFSKLQKRDFFSVLHPALAEFLAAMYLGSVAHYSNILRRELEDFQLEMEPCFATSAGVCRSLLHVLQGLAAHLGKKAYLLFNLLPNQQFPPKTLLQFLQNAGYWPPNIASVCKLLEGIHHVTVNTTHSNELQSWSCILQHAACPLPSLQISYEPSVATKHCSLLENLFIALHQNTSVSSLKITLVVSQDVNEHDMQVFADFLCQAMSKPLLRCIEIAISCVEDVSHEFLQAVIDAVCFSLDSVNAMGEDSNGNEPSIKGSLLRKIIIDMDLSAEQVEQLCLAVRRNPRIQSLSLLHLCCATSGLQAIAGLVYPQTPSGGNFLTSLDLSGSWASSPLEADAIMDASTVSLASVNNATASAKDANVGTRESSSGSGYETMKSQTNIVKTNVPSPVSVTVTEYPNTAPDNHLRASNGGAKLNASISAISLSTGASSSTRNSYCLTDNKVNTPDIDEIQPLHPGRGAQNGNSASNPPFLSLPRRPRNARGYSSLTRGMTLLSRQDEKRRSDSMLFQKILLPMPVCERESHCTNGFHTIFEALRNPLCQLGHLNMSKCSLTMADSVCLGESLRKNKSLVSLRLEGLSGMREVLPVILALAENSTLQLLDVSSAHIVFTDPAFQLFCRGLMRNQGLRSLRMAGWTFVLEDEDSFKYLGDLIQSTKLRELALTGANIKLPGQSGSGPLSLALLGPVAPEELIALLRKSASNQPLRSEFLAFLKLDQVTLSLQGKLSLRGPHLLPLLSGLTKLNDLHLGLERQDRGSQNCFEPLRDKSSIAFFQTLALNCNGLRGLYLQHWSFQWAKTEKTLKSIAKLLKSLAISHLNLDHVTVSTNAGNSGCGPASGMGDNAVGSQPYCDSLFLQTCITNLRNLSSLSLAHWKLSPAEAALVGKCMRDKHFDQLEVSMKGWPMPSVRSWIRALEEQNRTSLVYVGGPAQTYRITRNARNPSFLEKVMCITSWKEN